MQEGGDATRRPLLRITAPVGTMTGGVDSSPSYRVSGGRYLLPGAGPSTVLCATREPPATQIGMQMAMHLSSAPQQLLTTQTEPSTQSALVWQVWQIAPHRHRKPFPDAGLLPVAQTAPTSRAADAAECHRQHLPRNPALEHEDDASEDGTVRHTGAATLRLGRFLGQERFDGLPQVIGDQSRALHGPDDATPGGS